MPTNYAQIAEDHRAGYGTFDHHIDAYEDFYSDDLHFVYELLQNAQDAISADEEKNKRGLLRLVLRDHELLAYNDGALFSDRNVRAICSIRKSTKDLTQVGTHGIGFKATGKFTDLPEIYSGEERFRIRRKVEPEAIEETTEEIKALVGRGYTVFRLPFKSSLREGRVKALGERLRHIHKWALLFLHDLQSVEWIDEREGTQGIYARQVEAHPQIASARVVTLRSSRGDVETLEEKFLCFTQSTAPPDWVIQELMSRSRDTGERERIEGSRTHSQPVEIAFRLDSEGNVVPLTGESSVLFSFLPTSKDTGLRFLAQAHFKTTFARDNIRDVSEFGWNRWLISEIAALLPNVLGDLKTAGMLTPGVIRALPIPQEDVMDGEGKPPLLSPILAACVSALREQALVPIDTGHPEDIECRLAPQVFHPHNSDLRYLLGQRELAEVVANPEAVWTHSDLRWGADNEGDLLRAAGVREVEPEEVVTWLIGKNASWFEAKSDEWIVMLYRYLGSPSLRSERERLKPLPIARREDGRHICASEGVLFFPPTDTAEENLVRPLLSLLPLFRGSLLSLLKIGTFDDNVKSLLLEIGVRPLDLFGLLKDWFLPAYQRNHTQFTAEQNREHVRFVVLALTRLPYQENLTLLQAARSVPFLLCYQGRNGHKGVFKSPQEAYLSSSYTGSQDLETYFDGTNDVWFVGSHYPEETKADGDSNVTNSGNISKQQQSRWLKFLKDLGAATLPRIKPIPNAVIRDEFKNILRKNIGFSHDVSSDNYTLEGLDEVLSRISTVGANSRNASLSLWRLLVEIRKGWGRQQTFFALGVYKWFYQAEQSQRFGSDIDSKLKYTEWVLSDDGMFRTPQELYLPNAETQRVLGDRAHFLHPDLGVKEGSQETPQRTLAGTLKVRALVDIPTALEHLEYLSGSFPELKAVEEVYAVLQRCQIQQAEGRALFTSKALLYTPTPEPRWWIASETFWQSEQAAFGDTRGFLEEHYPASLKSFFASVNVPESAAFSDYGNALLVLSRDSSASDEAVRIRAHALYTLLWTKLQEPIATTSNKPITSAERTEIWQQLLSARCWLGCAGENSWGWHERASIFRNDHDYNTALFAPYLPFWAFPDLNALATFAEITASSQARIGFINDDDDNVEYELANWTQKARGLESPISTFLTSPRLVGEHFESPPLDFLKVLRVIRVSQASTTYTLNGLTVVDPKPLTSFLEVTEEGSTATLYVTAKTSEAEIPDLIGDALSLSLGAGQLGGFVSRMLSAEDQGRVLEHWQRLGLRYEVPIYNSVSDAISFEPHVNQDSVEIPSRCTDEKRTSSIAMPALPIPVAFPHSSQTEAGRSPADETIARDSDDSNCEGVSRDYHLPTLGAHFGITSSSIPVYKGGGNSLARFRSTNSWNAYSNRGGGEGETHKTLKARVRDNPGLIGAGLQFVQEEYQIASGLAGSEVDVLLRDAQGRPICVECKPYVAPNDYRPIWQAIRYKHLLAVDSGFGCAEVRAVLVAPYLPPDVQAKCALMGIESREVSVSLK